MSAGIFTLVFKRAEPVFKRVVQCCDVLSITELTATSWYRMTREYASNSAFIHRAALVVPYRAIAQMRKARLSGRHVRGLGRHPLLLRET